MLVTLAYPYTTKAGQSYDAGANVDVPNDEAQGLVYDGRARYATSGTPDTPLGIPLAYRGPFQAATLYRLRDVVSQASTLYRAKAAFTSGNAFNAADWELLAGTDAAALAGTYLTKTSGALATITDGTFGTGYSFPPGSLDRWRYARARSTVERLDVLVLGDSTTYGQTPTGTVGTEHPWTQNLRSLIRGAGFTDGGRGIINGAGSQFDLDGVAGITADNTTSPGGFSFGPLGTSSQSSSVKDQATTYQGKGTLARVYAVNLGSVSGGIAVSVDAGAETIFEPNAARAVDYTLVNLGAEGTHTVRVRNNGGRTIGPPPTPTTSLSSGGALVTGAAYAYQITQVTTAGETTPSAATAPVTIPNASNNVITITQNAVATGYVATGSYNIYRSLNGGAFQFLTNVAALGNGGLNYADTGAVAPTAATPPTTNTAGVGGSAATTYAVEFLRPTGIAVHNHGVSGITGASLLGADFLNDDANNSARLKAAFGLVPSPVGTVSPGYKAPQESKATARNVRLAVMVLGINDQQQSSADNSAALKIAGERFGSFCQAAGCDGVIVIPGLGAAAQQQNMALYRQALMDVAREYGLSWVDFGAPAVGHALSGTNPHLSATDYDAQAAFLWTNLLSK